MTARISFSICLPLATAVAILALLATRSEAGFSLNGVVAGWMPPGQHNVSCAQLDLDEPLEVIVVHMGGRAVSIYDGVTWAVEFNAEFDTNEYYPTQATITAMDVDRDGLLEVLVSAIFPGPGAQTMIIETDAPAAVPDGLPDTYPAILGQNVPNPFTLGTEIRYTLPTPGYVELRIYDVQGRLVRSMGEHSVTAGEHVAHWDGRTDEGDHAAAGVYYYQLVTPGGSQTRKTIRLR